MSSCRYLWRDAVLSLKNTTQLIIDLIETEVELTPNLRERVLFLATDIRAEEHDIDGRCNYCGCYHDDDELCFGAQDIAKDILILASLDQEHIRSFDECIIRQYS